MLEVSRVPIGQTLLQREKIMRKSFKYTFCILIILLTTGSLWAKDKYIVTVLPFTLHSSENIEYVKQGIEDMLITRISVPNKIDVTGKDVVQEELKKSSVKEISPADVYNIGKKLKSDYVVWGSITKIGSSISVDGKLVDIGAAKSDVGFYTQSQNLDEVIPKINDFSQKIVQHILGATPQVDATAPAAAVPPPTPQNSREAQIIAGMKSGKKGTLTSVINPEYINSPDPFNRRGFWMSQNFPTEFKGMDIGDVNGDGLNEIVTIDAHNVYIYQKVGNELKLLEKIAGKLYDTYLAVDVADINKNGIKEIIVTSLNGSTLDSFVLEYKNGKYIQIASGLTWFLRVIDTPSGIPLLMGQALGIGDNFAFKTPIYEIIYSDGKYISHEKMKTPLGLSVYGLNFENLGAGSNEKIIALDELDYLCIFEKTNKPLSRIFTFGFKNEELIWRSDDVYGGSNNYIDDDNKNRSSEVDAKSAFINLRILTHDTNKDGKKEIIIVKNLSSVGRILKNLKLFTSSEIYNLEWDGMGMAENWRTKKINGYVADYVLKDIDNDGKPEIVLALVLSVGTSIKDKSVIVVYKLDAAQ
jgi:TolB-like protein